MGDYVPRYAEPSLWQKFKMQRPDNLRPGTACSDHNGMAGDHFNYQAFVLSLQPGADAEELYLQASVNASDAYLDESISNKCGCLDYAKRRLEYDKNRLAEYLLNADRIGDPWTIIDQFKEPK